MTMHRSGRRGPAALLIAGLALGGIGGMITAGLPALAQTGWSGGSAAEDLRYRLDVLDAELADIRARIGGGAPAPATGGGPAGVLSNSRVAELEGELRRLTAAVEELQNQVRRIGEEAARRFSDIEFRLTELEGGDVSVLQPVEPLGGVAGTQAAPPEPPTGPASSTTGSAGQSGAGGLLPPVSGIVAGPTGQGGFQGMEVPPPRPSDAQQMASISEGEREELARAAEDVRQGRYDQAEERLRRFLNKSPDSLLRPEAWYWLGESQFVRGNHSEAARSFLSGYNANKTGRRAPHNLYRLGVTLGRLGQVGEACLTLREVRTQFPAAPDGLAEQADAESDALDCG